MTFRDYLHGSDTICEKIDFKLMEKSKGFNDIKKILEKNLSEFALVQSLYCAVSDDNHLKIAFDLKYNVTTRPYFVETFKRDEKYEVGSTSRDYFDIEFNIDGGKRSAKHYMKVAKILEAFSRCADELNEYISKAKRETFTVFEDITFLKKKSF